MGSDSVGTLGPLLGHINPLTRAEPVPPFADHFVQTLRDGALQVDRYVAWLAKVPDLSLRLAPCAHARSDRTKETVQRSACVIAAFRVVVFIGSALRRRSRKAAVAPAWDIIRGSRYTTNSQCGNIHNFYYRLLMALISIIAALVLEQLYALPKRDVFDRVFFRYAKMLERVFNTGEQRQGIVAWLAGVLLPVALVSLVYFALAQLSFILAMIWNIVVLYFTMGFRRFSHSFTEISQALQENDIAKARSLLSNWRGETTAELNQSEVARLAIEHGLLCSHRHVFGVIAWFFVLPGPIGAAFYQFAAQLGKQWAGKNHQDFGYFGAFAKRAFEIIDWIPARLTAISFAVVGDFEDAIYCWRSQATAWLHRSQGIILASGAGALGVQLGDHVHQYGGISARPKLGLGDEPDIDHLESAVGLIWRALVLWLTLGLLLTVARWV